MLKVILFTQLSSFKLVISEKVGGYLCNGPAEANFSRKFTLVSCFQLLKQTPSGLCFGLVLFEIISHQFFDLAWSLSGPSALVDALTSHYGCKEHIIIWQLFISVFFYCICSCIVMSFFQSLVSHMAFTTQIITRQQN